MTRQEAAVVTIFAAKTIIFLWSLGCWLQANKLAVDAMTVGSHQVQIAGGKGVRTGQVIWIFTGVGSTAQE